jgi:hypothetical protein
MLYMYIYNIYTYIYTYMARAPWAHGGPWAPKGPQNTRKHVNKYENTRKHAETCEHMRKHEVFSANKR